MAEHWISLGKHSRASAKMLLGAYADGFEIGTTPDLVCASYRAPQNFDKHLFVSLMPVSQELKSDLKIIQGSQEIQAVFNPVEF